MRFIWIQKHCGEIMAGSCEIAALVLKIPGNTRFFLMLSECVICLNMPDPEMADAHQAQEERDPNEVRMIVADSKEHSSRVVPNERLS